MNNPTRLANWTAQAARTIAVCRECRTFSLRHARSSMVRGNADSVTFWVAAARSDHAALKLALARLAALTRIAQIKVR